MEFDDDYWNINSPINFKEQQSNMREDVNSVEVINQMRFSEDEIELSMDLSPETSQLLDEVINEIKAFETKLHNQQIKPDVEPPKQPHFNRNEFCMKLEENYPKGLVVCPNNNFHILQPFQLCQHLLTCHVRNPATGYIICPLNEEHQIPDNLYELHVKLCWDIKKMIQYCLDKVTVVTYMFHPDDSYSTKHPPLLPKRTILSKAVQTDSDEPSRSSTIQMGFQALPPDSGEGFENFC